MKGTNICEQADIAIGTIAGQARRSSTNHPMHIIVSCAMHIAYTGHIRNNSCIYTRHPIASLLVELQEIDRFNRCAMNA